MKTQKGFSIILLIAIGAIAATFGWIAYATWQQSVDDSNFTLTIPFLKHKVKTTNTNKTANTNTASNTNTAISTAGWITYTNSTLGFSLKLPPDWKGYRESCDAALVSITNPTTSSTISVQTLSETAIPSNQSPKPQNDEKVGTKNGKNYFLKGFVDTQNEVPAIKETFAFVESKNEWKTYRNDDFSIQYPPCWKLSSYYVAKQIADWNTSEQQVSVSDPVAMTLDEWLIQEKTHVGEAFRSSSTLTVGGEPAVRANVTAQLGAGKGTEFAQIAVRHNGKIFNIISLDAEMINNGMLDTFTFTPTP